MESYTTALSVKEDFYDFSDPSLSVSAFTRDEGLKFFAALVNRELGMSDTEFLYKYRNGDYRNVDVDDIPGLDEVLAFIGLVQ